MSHELYLSLPPFCQNIALSAYGMTLYKQRFGGSLPSTYDSANPLFSKPTPADIELQTLRLRQLLTHCTGLCALLQALPEISGYQHNNRDNSR